MHRTELSCQQGRVVLFNQQEIWYCLKQYTHPSWLDGFKLALLHSRSSGLLWNLAYVDLCSWFSIEAHAPESITDNDLNALRRFVQFKERIFELMMICLDTAQSNRAHSTDDLLYCAQISQALSMRERFEQYKYLFGENGSKVFVEFLCYCFFRKEHPSVSSRAKVQFNKNHLDSFSKMNGKISEPDLRVISHMYKSLTNYLQGNI
jgi:hypothetical protein